MKRYIWLILMVTIVFVIFLFSNQGAGTSHNVSNMVAEHMNIQPQNEWTEVSQTPVILGFDIRKLAHIVLYAALGLTTVKTFRSGWKTLLFCYGYACFDEIHQMFVIGRGACFKDTLIDVIGFGVVILIWEAIRYIKSMKELKGENG